MGIHPLSPASSVDGIAQLGHYMNAAATTTQSLSVQLYCERDQHHLRYHAEAFSGESALFGRCSDNNEANAASVGTRRFQSADHQRGRQAGRHVPQEASGGALHEVASMEGASQVNLALVHASYPPEMTPPAEDFASSRSGSGIPKRPPPAADAQRARRRQVIKRRKQAKTGKRALLCGKPLSSISAEGGDALVFDVDSFVHRPTGVRKQEQQKEGKVKRPLNDFVLYRKAYSAVAKEQVMVKEHKNNQQLVSQICGESWGIETVDIKAKFKKLASVERAKHFQAFPDYKYAPKPGKKPKDTPTDKGATARGGGAESQCAMVLTPQFVAQLPDHLNYVPRADAVPLGHAMGSVAMGHLAQYAPAGPHWSSPGMPSVFGAYGHLGQDDMFGYGRGLVIKEETPPPALSTAHLQQAPSMQRQPDASLCGVSASPLDLCIDPSLLPRTSEPMYHQYMPPEGVPLITFAGPPPLAGPGEDMMMAAVPDLSIDGAHNAYLRGTEADWQVELLDEASHFNDWMAQEEHTFLH